MSYIPYNYQEDGLVAIDRARETGRDRALIVMATGLGKTMTVAFDVERFMATRPQGRMLYLCHQNEIIGKSQETFQRVIGGPQSDYGYYHGGAPKDKDARFVFASFQTMTGSLRQFSPTAFDYIVVDEAHHSHAQTYGPVIKYFQPEWLLGMTATPDRADMQDITHFYGPPVYELGLEEALARNLLTPVDYRLITDEIVNVGEIKHPEKMSLAELNKTVFAPKRDEQIVDIIGRKIAEVGIVRPKVLTFCASTDHVDHLVGGLLPRSAAMHSKVGRAEREAALAAFKVGRVQNLVTVNMFNEGVDFPDVNVLVFLRTTESDTIWKQQLGRGLRVSKSKSSLLVLDFAGNCERVQAIHGLSQAIRQQRVRLEATEHTPREAPKITTTQMSQFTFDDRAVNLIDVIQRTTEGYTKERVIELLQAEAKMLGRPPTFEEIEVASKEKRMPSTPTIVKLFITYNKALKAAGLSLRRVQLPNDSQKAKKKVIELLQALSIKLGATPTIHDINKANKEKLIPSLSVIYRLFNGYGNALYESGLATKTSRRFKLPKELGKQKKQIIRLLKAEAKRLGRTPLTKDIINASKEKRMPSIAYVSRVFGSYSQAQAAAGLSKNKQVSKTNTVLGITQTPSAKLSTAAQKSVPKRRPKFSKDDHPDRR